MSGLSLTETDPVLQIYEAQAIIVEKNQEIERLRQENERQINQMRQEIERLRMENSNKNQLELAQKVIKLEEDLASKTDNLSDKFETLEFAVNQKVTKLEEDLAASKADNLQLKEQITALHMNFSKNNKLSDKEGELVANKSRNQKEISQKEEELAESENKHFELINRLISLDVKQLNEKDELSQQNLFSCDQNAVRTENKVEKESEGQQNTSILILGGWRYLNTIYLLDSKAQSWKKLRITRPVGMQDFGAVELNEEIYIFGGCEYYSRNSHKNCYKLKDDGSWMKLASLNQERGYISNSSLVYKGDIWVIGGHSGKDVRKSVEKYDISQDKWTYMPEMNYPRCHAAAAVFNDRIFVTGKYNEESSKSVEMFDSKLQKWILFCDLPFELSSHTMLINNSILSIFGGQSGSVRGRRGSLNSVWEIDIEDPEKKWTDKQSFKHPRGSFGIGKISNGIIVFGDSGSIFDYMIGSTSEIFDGNKWIDGPKLPQKLLRFAYTSIPRSLEESFLKKFS